MGQQMSNKIQYALAEIRRYQWAIEENALRASIDKLGKHASLNKTNVHINKCGTEEEWDVIQKLLEELVARRGVNIYLYES